MAPVDIGAVKKVYNDRQAAMQGPAQGQGGGMQAAPGQMKQRTPRIPAGSMQRAMQRRQAMQPKPQPVEEITRYAPQPGPEGSGVGVGAPMQALPVGTPTAYRPMMPDQGAPMQALPVGPPQMYGGIATGMPNGMTPAMLNLAMRRRMAPAAGRWAG